MCTRVEGGCKDNEVISAQRHMYGTIEDELDVSVSVDHCVGLTRSQRSRMALG